MSRSIGAFYRRIGQRTFTAALEQNDRNIEQALAASAPRERLLDLGCDDGARTMPAWRVSVVSTSPRPISARAFPSTTGASTPSSPTRSSSTSSTRTCF